MNFIILIILIILIIPINPKIPRIPKIPRQEVGGLLEDGAGAGAGGGDFVCVAHFLAVAEGVGEGELEAHVLSGAVCADVRLIVAAGEGLVRCLPA